MKNQHLTNDDIISAVRGLSLRDFKSIKDLNYSLEVLELKARQIKEEIRKRKADGKN